MGDVMEVVFVTDEPTTTTKTETNQRTGDGQTRLVQIEMVRGVGDYDVNFT